MARSLQQWEAFFRKHFSGRRVARDIRAVYRQARWNSTERLNALAGEVVGWLSKIGFRDAEAIPVPADGTTCYGGWAMPLAWSPRAATLDLIPENGRPIRLADYAKNPHNLIQFSGATPARGVEAELAVCPQPLSGRALEAVRGKIVLLPDNPWAYMQVARKLMRAGARGVVTDHVIRIPGVKEGAYLDEAVQYYNYLWPPYRVPARERGFGFALTPAAGHQLRERLERGETVRLRAHADVSLGKDTFPVITGLLPGGGGQEILLTGHIDEPGANDNASGPMMAVEIARVLARASRKGEPLRRGIRVFFSIEARGLQAVLNERPELFRRGVAGLNLDMVGCDQKTVHSTLKIGENTPALPDYAYPLLVRCAERLRRRAPAFSWRSGYELDDNAPGEPLTGAPTVIAEQAPDKTYHTSLDTPDWISESAMRRLGVLFGSHIGFLADAGAPEVRRLAKVNRAFSEARLKEKARQLAKKKPPEADQYLRYHIAKEKRRVTGLLRLLPPEGPLPFVPEEEKRPLQLRSDHLSETAAARKAVDEAARGVERAGARLLGRGKGRRSAARATADPWRKKAERLVPLKKFRGFFASEDLSGADAEALYKAVGARLGWGAPGWLQDGLFASTGKTTLADIGTMLRAEGYDITDRTLVRTFRCLETQGKVRFRAFLKKADVARSLRAAGVCKGMLLVAHSSLSQFGYAEDGPATLIDALLSVLGPKGTLAMPTHSYNWLGQPVYDPASSPSRVGAVTNAFLKVPGVRRSAHPTHSVAARGPLAERLIEEHTAAVPPLAREGFWGRFVENDGRVLMLSPLGSNTLMHAAELWSGAPLPAMVVPARRKGRWTRTEVPHLPLHTNWFPRLYDKLSRARKIRKADLGESAIHLMRGRDVVEAGQKLLAKNPELVAPEGCACAFCEHVRAHLAERKR